MRGLTAVERQLANAIMNSGGGAAQAPMFPTARSAGTAVAASAAQGKGKGKGKGKGTSTAARAPPAYQRYANGLNPLSAAMLGDYMKAYGAS
jgi:hypothetical protein